MKNKNNNTPNYLALICGFGFVIALFVACIISFIDGEVKGAIFQLLVALVFAYFSIKEIQNPTIEPKKDNT